MEPRFDRDFSRVRVHTDGAAAASAHAVGAEAYTVGDHVVFGSGKYRPHTDDGRSLLAHELTHTLQQAGAPSSGPLVIGAPDTAAEHEASSIASRVTDADHVEAMPLRHRVAQPTLMRKTDFSSTVKIGAAFLKSREFEVSQGGLVVTTDTYWDAPDDWPGTFAPECGRDEYDITLYRSNAFGPFDKTVATCESRNGELVSRNFTNLPTGTYYLEITTGNTNPGCVLKGDIHVEEVSDLEGENCGGGYTRDIAKMQPSEKIVEAIQRSFEKMPGETGERLKELLTPEAIALMVVFLSAYVVSQVTPYGWLADLIVLGLLIVTLALVGREVVEIAKLLIDFYSKAINAKSKEDLDEAAELFARAVTKAGVDVIVAIIFHKAGKAMDLKPPGPRSPGLAQVIESGAKNLHQAMTEPVADLVTEYGVVRVPVEELPNVYMSEATKPGASGKAGGVSKGSATGEMEGAGGNANEPAKTTKKLPGKDTIAGEGVIKEVAKENAEPAKPRVRETGAQQEKRLLSDDAGRPAKSTKYFDYWGKTSGSFDQWFARLQKHIDRQFKNSPNKPKLNGKPLAEKTMEFINRHEHLRMEWERLTRPLENRLNQIQRWKSAKGVDARRLSELNAMEEAILKEREPFDNFERGTVGSKRPDFVEVFFEQNRAEVTDITQRTWDEFHNLKTQVYVEVVKEVLGVSDVRGVNFNDVFDMTFSE